MEVDGRVGEEEEELVQADVEEGAEEQQEETPIGSKGGGDDGTLTGESDYPWIMMMMMAEQLSIL